MNAIDRQDHASLSLVSIYEISKILSAAHDLRASLRAVLNLMSSYMEMRSGIVAIVDGAAEAEVFAAVGGSGGGDAPGGVDPPTAVARSILSGHVPFVTEDVSEHPLLADYLRAMPVLDGERVSFIGVPIKTIGRPFGLLAIARVWDEAGAISFGDDVRFLTMTANLIAQSVIVHRAMAAPPTASRARSAATPNPTPTSARPRTGQAVNCPIPAALHSVIGVSKPMQEVFAQVHLVAPTKSAVILRGESGTGKELIARAVHTLSPRKDAPFIKVNCAALPDTLLESELFGHDKGAFTGATQDRKGRFELADRGTLFLDEIGDISPAFQAKLLRVLQEKEFERVGGTRTMKVDVRIVCATNRNLEDAVAKGEFRADLYYRINVVPVFIPALRERSEDIPLLAEHFLKNFNDENGRQLRLSAEALRILSRCAFPGNVRELENCIHRMATMTRSEIIGEIDVPCQTARCQCQLLMPREAFADAPAAADDEEGGGVADWIAVDDLTDLEALPQRDRLIRVMEKAGWVQAKAARLLGLTPRQVGYALRKYNVSIKRL